MIVRITDKIAVNSATVTYVEEVAYSDASLETHTIIHLVGGDFVPVPPEISHDRVVSLLDERNNNG